MVERFNCTLTGMLSMYVYCDHTNWDIVLLFVVFVHNYSLQQTTGFSLFHLLYGRDAMTRFDTVLLYVPDGRLDDYTTSLLLYAEAAR